MDQARGDQIGEFEDPPPMASNKEHVIGKKNQNSFAKRKREMDKKFKAEAKRARRLSRKSADVDGEPDELSTDELTDPIAESTPEDVGDITQPNEV